MALSFARVPTSPRWAPPELVDFGQQAYGADAGQQEALSSRNGLEQNVTAFSRGAAHGANLTGPRQSNVFSRTRRRTRRPLKLRFDRDAWIENSLGGCLHLLGTGPESLLRRFPALSSRSMWSPSARNRP